MPRRGKSSKPTVRVGNAYAALPLPSGVPVPMCFCGNPCKVAESDEEDTTRRGTLCAQIIPSTHHLVWSALGCWWECIFLFQYFWCHNVKCMIRVQPLNVLQTPPPLCDFEQWIDTEIKEYDSSSIGGQFRCIEEGKVASLHAVVVWFNCANYSSVIMY